jgi:GNAT superfamily N-acetyltransferase
MRFGRGNACQTAESLAGWKAAGKKEVAFHATDASRLNARVLQRKIRDVSELKKSQEKIEVRAARVEELIELRHAVLRPGRPRAAAVYDEDELPSTRHFIALAGAGERVVGCVTIFPQPWEGRPAWQLRGMGVADDFQGAGVGRKLLEAVDQFMRGLAPPIPMMWCNARVTAIGFYQRCGWAVASDVFDVPTVGPHVKMTRQL